MPARQVSRSECRKATETDGKSTGVPSSGWLRYRELQDEDAAWCKDIMSFPEERPKAERRCGADSKSRQSHSHSRSDWFSTMLKDA
eukprot:Skav236651  [mRNA]  locus=scaffold691:224178:226533:- [translate_table: standard]